LEDLSSRLQHLEDIVLSNTVAAGVDTSFSARSLSARNNDRQTTPNGKAAPFESDKPSPSILKSYRGATSTWTTLLTQLEFRSEDSPSPLIDSFQEMAAKFANAERSSHIASLTKPYNLLQRFPNLPRDDVLSFVKAYAIEAPYPILHYDSLMQITETLLDNRCLERCGQIVCVLMVMTSSLNVVAERKRERKGLQLTETCGYPVHGLRLRTRGKRRVKPIPTIKVRIISPGRMGYPPGAASGPRSLGFESLDSDGELPKLPIPNTLKTKRHDSQVHYLQASSQPSRCWALLGTASRIAISLGFHQNSHKVDNYSDVEMEEGKRAWWLCYIMEKYVHILMPSLDSRRG
jgi:Fungal specific transcription factor domain